MGALEAIGFCWVIFTALLGHAVLAEAAYAGYKRSEELREKGLKRERDEAAMRDLIR